MDRLTFERRVAQVYTTAAIVVLFEALRAMMVVIIVLQAEVEEVGPLVRPQNRLKIDIYIYLVLFRHETGGPIFDTE